jgi:uncharacterized protein (TIGR03437 family)
VIRGSVFIVVASLFLTLRLPAQPVVSQGGILNAASYSYSALPGGSIAQGSMFIVFGAKLGTTSSGSLSFPLQTSMDGTSIDVTSGSTTVKALMIYTTPGQVAAILPSNTPTGSGTLTLTYNNQSSAEVPIEIAPSSFGAFTQNQGGSGPAIIQDYVSATELPVNTIVAPAYPGQTVILWGTGLGPIPGTNADAGAPPPTDMQTALNVQVWVGNQPATVTYAGRSGCCAAIDQIDFVVPQGVQGCYLPVAVKAGTAGVVSNVPSIAVAPSAGAACSDADGINSSDVTKLQSAGSVKLGSVNLTHVSLNLGLLGIPPVLSDVATGIFGTYSQAQLSASLGLTQSPSVGSCTVSQFLGVNPIPVDPTKPSPLDEGSALSITGGSGTKAIPSTSTGFYSATLGGVPLSEILTATPEPAYFDPGSYTLSGSGGAVGSFSSSFTVPAALSSNASTITTIDRSKDLTITWSGAGQNGFVAVSATSSVGGTLGPGATSPGNVILCIAPASAGTFTIPSFVLATLAPTPTMDGMPVTSAVPNSYLLVGTQTEPINFSASGLDDGYLTYRSLIGNGVTVQ